MNNKRGFSLVELLIVVAIVLVLAAIAIPNFMRSKMSANQASAAASLRTMGTANAVYFSIYHLGFLHPTVVFSRCSEHNFFHSPERREGSLSLPN